MRRIVLLGLFLLLQTSVTGQVEPTRRILILNEVGPSYPAISIIDKGIRTGLQNSPYHLEFYTEYLDTILFPDAADQQRFRDFYVDKYKKRPPDVIITVGPAALRFMRETHQKAFAGIPIVFCLPQGLLPGSPDLDPEFTGVEIDMAPAETLEAALRLQPGTKHVVVIGGVSAFDRQEEAVVKERLRAYENRVRFTYMTELAMPILLERLKHLPDHTVVLMTSLSQDAAGKRFIGASGSGPMVAAAASAPVFSLFDVYLGHGEVGGDLSSIFEQGRTAGSMAVRLLNGERPKDIPRVRGVITYMFDWPALKRWGMEEKNLPGGSVLLNRQPTLWKSYKWYIGAGIFLILFESGLIGALIWQRGRRKKAEREVTAAFQAAQESEQRFRLLANTAPVMIWTAGPDKQCDYFNQNWLEFTGRPLKEQLGSGWSESVHPQDLKLCLDTYTQSFDQREPFTMQYRLQRSRGDYRWVLDTGIPRFNSDGSFVGYIGSCIDITDRKLAEEALSSVSRRLIDAQEQERSHIARELHDDINQRIAMLEVELDVLQQRPPDSLRQLRSRLGELRVRLAEISSEIQAISHRLHSSKLQYLGLVAACKSFCRDVAEWHKVSVGFTAQDIPPALPQDVSLCLFRVLQESLNNAIKHSGAQHFDVHLKGASGHIQLTVHDDGTGFDVATAMGGQGLGLISMRERVNLVHGLMLIASKPAKGTDITVHVPVPEGATQMTATAV